jgi:glycosyltransferase involved in cell wall biosynthesis
VWEVENSVSAATPPDPLVSVVIPAFNASRTLVETLSSVSAQTYSNLEILVVDDGSTDATRLIAEEYTSRDPRVRLTVQSNAGVASARNTGIRISKAELIAFIDADDLWHPTKIAKQVKVLLAGGPEMALVYAPFRFIDAAGKVVRSSEYVGIEGWVLYRLFHRNFIGNGSSVLVHKKILLEVGGFAAWLREAGAEGAEDQLMQLKIASRYRFGIVNEYLVGYRKHASAMSADAEQMSRSGALAIRAALREVGELPGLNPHALICRYEVDRAVVALRRKRLLESLRLSVVQLSRHPLLLTKAAYEVAAAAIEKRFIRKKDAGNHHLRDFYSHAPDEGINAQNLPSLLKELAPLDEAYSKLLRETASKQLVPFRQ